jgi:hypothetical protein
MVVLTNACDNVSCVVQVFIDEMLTLLLSYASVDSSDTRAILGAGIALLIQLGVSPNELNLFCILCAVRSYYGRPDSADGVDSLEHFDLMCAMKRSIERKFEQQQLLRATIVIQSHVRGWLERRRLASLSGMYLQHP